MFSNPKSNYEYVKNMVSSIKALNEMAIRELEEKYNISVYNINLDDHRFARAIVVPEDVYRNEELAKKIHKYVVSTYQKYHLEVVSSERRGIHEYEINWQGIRCSKYIISFHYYFEITPYMSINHSEIVSYENVFLNNNKWKVVTSTPCTSPNNYYVYTELIDTSDVE
jgi:hypothetical protein